MPRSVIHGHFGAATHLPYSPRHLSTVTLGQKSRPSPGGYKEGEEAELKELLAAYEDEGSAYRLYTRALLAFREGGGDNEQAVTLVKGAWSANEHVPAILAGTTRPLFEDSGYVTAGGADEATHYLTEFGPAWHRTPGAVEWLAKITSTLPPKQRTYPVGH